MAANKKPKALTERDYQTLDALMGFHGRFVRPLDIGGSDNSHHSRTLAKLARRFMVERRMRGRVGAYKITLVGEAALQLWKDEH